MIANELRIGNWINYLGKPKKCSLNTIYAISRIVGDSAVYRPIPLTSEILAKCKNFGRTTIQDEDSFFNGDNILLRIADWGLFMHSEVDGSVFFVRRLKYLHELQNAYFCITQTELTIDLLKKFICL